MFPQFLGIGAQKSGTSWLFWKLKHHPQIWLPPVKEIHYFNQNSSKPSVIDLLFGSPFSRIRLRRQMRRAWRKKGQNIGWYLRYFFQVRSDDWYASLFSPSVGQIAGESTPNYSILDAERVGRIHTLMPELKIIYLLRNPIHRTWSQLNRHDRQTHFRGNYATESVIKQFMVQEEPHRHSNYPENLQIWSSFYPQEQIFIGFFEQIAENPRQLLSDLYQFLDVDSSEQYIPPNVHKKVNAGQYSPIPAHWARYLAERYHEQLKLLHDRFNNCSTASWLEVAEEYLGVC